MDTTKRLTNFANKQKGALSHLHVEGGFAYACSQHTLLQIPTDLPDCPPDCGFPSVEQVKKQASDYQCLIDVSLDHLIKSVKIAAAIHSGRTQADKRDSNGKRFITLSANGSLDVSAFSELGTTTTRLEHGDTWRVKWLRSKGGYGYWKTSEVFYMHAGQDCNAHFEAGKLLDVLTLMRDTGAERVELIFWHGLGYNHMIARTEGAEAILMGCLDPNEKE